MGNAHEAAKVATTSGSEMAAAALVDKPQIIYALVTRGAEVVLADYSALTGNFEETMQDFLQKLDRTVEWKSYVNGEQALHYIIDGQTWFLCLADRDMERRVVFAFLAALQQSFK